MKLDETQKVFAGALGRVPSGIFIVTVVHADQETGMLASWVQQCSFAPPRVSLAIQPGREIVKLLTADASLAVNLLESSQTDMVAHFGKGFPLGDDAFRGLEVERHPGKAPVLKEALAYLEGRVVERFAAGDHDLFILEVVGGRVLDEGQPMIHIRKNGFHY